MLLNNGYDIYAITLRRYSLSNNNNEYYSKDFNEYLEDIDNTFQF